MLSTTKKSTAAEPQNLRKGLAFKDHGPNLISNPWILSATLPQMTFQSLKRKQLQGLRNDYLPRQPSHVWTVRMSFFRGAKNLSHCHHSNSEDQKGKPHFSPNDNPSASFLLSSSSLLQHRIPSFFHHFSHDLILCSLQFFIFLFQVYI